MPELPEVKTVCKKLDEALKGKVIKNVIVKKEKLIKEISVDKFRENLIDKRILGVFNKGKFIIFKLSDSIVMLSHLRMEGKYHFEKWDNPKHDHVEFVFTDNTSLYYNDTRQFGTFHLKNLENYLLEKPLNTMGPEPEFADKKALFSTLKTKKKPIKTLLLEQSFLSGIGNIYADEVLWSAKIHPLTPANAITENQFSEIIDFATTILDKATKAGGTTIRSYASLDNKGGEFQDFLNVHTKEGMPCPRCQTPIIKIKVGGRGTYLCPKEQKEKW